MTQHIRARSLFNENFRMTNVGQFSNGPYMHTRSPRLIVSYMYERLPLYACRRTLVVEMTPISFFILLITKLLFPRIRGQEG